MKNVADVYPLSPMQEMMLLHSLSRGAAADVLFNQFCYRLSGELDAGAFRLAWERLLERHPVLRTCFLWEGLKQPLQVVRQQVSLPFEEHDWRARCPGEQQAALQALRADDRERGFDPARAPLMRVHLARLADREWLLIWSSHHLLLDRWCLADVFDDLFALYAGARGDPVPPLPAARGFRDYINWIRQQDPQAARRFWRSALRGYREPVAITSAAGERGHEPAIAEVELAPATSKALRAFARRHGLTTGALFQGAWALVLNRCSARQDVVFGAAVAARPPQLPGVDSIVGSFVNNLPVRVRMPHDASVGDWLHALQRAQQRRSPFEHLSLNDIHACSELGDAERLFDTLLVWLAPDSTAPVPGLEVQGLAGALVSAYPLTLGIAEAQDQFALRLVRAAGFATEESPVRLLEHYRGTLSAVLDAGAGAKLASLAGFRGRESFDLELPPAAPVEVEDADRHAADEETLVGGREAFDRALLRDLVREEWRQVLGRSGFGDQENFFDLGGESILASRLHARLEAVTRKSVPLLALFREPTVARMVRTLGAGQWPLKADLVVPIRAAGGELPLFCIASPEVNTLGYMQLHRHLDPQRPLYVLQEPPRAEVVLEPTREELPALAQRYLAGLRKVQPHGPYLFLARCTGAHLALEMARQLHADDETVAFLGVANTWAFHTVSRLYHLHRAHMRTMYYWDRLVELARLGPRSQWSELRRVLAGRFPGRRRATPGETHSPAPVATRPPTVPGEERSPVIGWAHRRVAASKYPGTLTVFRTRRQRYWRIRDRYLGWRAEAEQVQLKLLPGRRGKDLLREPFIREFAAAIEACIEQAKTRRAAADVSARAPQTATAIGAGAGVTIGSSAARAERRGSPAAASNRS